MDGVKVLMAVEVVASDVAEASQVVVLAAVASQVAEAALAAAASAAEASAAADLCRIVKTFIVYKRGRVNLTHPFFRIHPSSFSFIACILATIPPSTLCRCVLMQKCPANLRGIHV